MKNTVKTDQLMDKITQAVIKSIEGGTAPWLKPWISRHDSNAPINITTSKTYKGLNALYLSLLGDSFNCNYWAGMGQIKKKGGRVLEAEKYNYTQILAPMTFKKKDEKTGKESFFLSGFRSVNVYNITQCEGIDIPVIDDVPRTLQADRLDKFMIATGADIRHGGDRACFIPSQDQINMPEKNQFINEGGYYGTLLHELTHWTGHKARLNRLDDKSKRGYAFEELVAELGAYYASERLGCPNETENHASYLQSWLKALRDDKKYLWQAASQAEKAANYLLKLADDNSAAQAA